MNDTAIVILAAGNSSRLGTPKQLLPWGDQLLVQSIARAALDARPSSVLVVTGAQGEEVAAALQAIPVDLVFNKDWAEGMASSIVTAMKSLLEAEKRIQTIILAVCDQPFVSTDLFLKMAEVHRNKGKGIVACSYAGSAGTPVLFQEAYFEELRALQGTMGAKSLLKKHKKDLALIDFPAGNIDIDTPGDYQQLISGFQKP